MMNFVIIISSLIYHSQEEQMAALHTRHDQDMVSFYSLFDSAMSKSQYSPLAPNRKKTLRNYVQTLSVK